MRPLDPNVDLERLFYAHYRGQSFGLARRVNFHLNSQIQGGNHYES